LEISAAADRNDMLTDDGGAPASFMPRPFEFIVAILGFIVLALALPVVLLAGGPFNGWVTGALLFTFSWLAHLGITKVAQGLEPTMAVGLIGFSSIGRAIVVVLILFLIAGLVDRVMGLVGAGVFAAAFTFDLTGRTVLHALREKQKKLERSR